MHAPATVAIHDLHHHFLRLLPGIESHAQTVFRSIRCPHQKADRVQEVVAVAWEQFLSASVAGHTPDSLFASLAQNAADRARQGQPAALDCPLASPTQSVESNTVYRGTRSPAIACGRGEVTVTVQEPGAEPHSLDPCHRLRNHSPTGFEWGYGGSGPAQLALALAAHVVKDDERTLRVYQHLKGRLVARLPHDGWTLTESQLWAVILALEEAPDGGGADASG